MSDFYKSESRNYSDYDMASSQCFFPSPHFAIKPRLLRNISRKLDVMQMMMMIHFQSSCCFIYRAPIGTFVKQKKRIIENHFGKKIHLTFLCVCVCSLRTYMTFVVSDCVDLCPLSFFEYEVFKKK